MDNHWKHIGNNGKLWMGTNGKWKKNGKCGKTWDMSGL